ncbi:MAG: cytidine deaminase [Bacteroidia bacterium]
MDQSYHIAFRLLDDASTLPTDEVQLLETALEASKGAYAPYSHFHVGCAIALNDGSVATGNNQENPAFPSSLCAERTVLYYLGSQGNGGQIKKIAIRATSRDKLIAQPVTPCGACRQVMLEYERMSGHPVVVLMQGQDGQVLRVEGVAATLMPFSFDIEF